MFHTATKAANITNKFDLLPGGSLAVQTAKYTSNKAQKVHKSMVNNICRICCPGCGETARVTTWIYCSLRKSFWSFRQKCVRIRLKRLRSNIRTAGKFLCHLVPIVKTRPQNPASTIGERQQPSGGGMFMQIKQNFLLVDLTIVSLFMPLAKIRPVYRTA